MEYDKYCPRCEHKDKNPVRTENSDGTRYVDFCDECHICLNEPAQPDSHKPLMFKQKGK